jgi:ABC-2 type transport system permease protein
VLARIAAFEVRYQLRSPLFFIGYALFFLLTFGAVTVDQVQIGAAGNVNVNSPYAILQTVGIMNVFGIFVITAFVANVVIRDDETGFAPIIRATRVSKFDYLVGRFAGAWLVALLVMTSVPFAMLIGSLMPWLDSEKVGPFIAGHYLYALFIYTAPTLLVSGAGFFALATATRSMMWTYVGVVAFLVLFLTSRVMLSDPAFDLISALSDPFALGALSQGTKYWTATERNTLLPAVEGLLLYNRLIWIGVAAALFALAYGVFRFEAKGKQVKARKRARAAAAEPPPVAKPLGSPRADRAARWQQFAALTRFDMQFVFRSPAFFVLLALGVLNAFGGLTQTVENRGTEYLPVTRALIEVLTGAFTLFPIIIAIYYAGELVWRDRERRMHEIVDATAAPNWAFMVPKIIAIILVLSACFLLAVVTAVGFQLYHGYTHIEPLAYLLWFVLPGLITAVLLAALSVFVQALVPHKAVGWAVMLVYLVANVALSGAGFEHNLYNYGGVPPVPLSDMNGMGRFWEGRAWFQAYWLAFALMLLVTAHLLWRRGADTSLRPRLAHLPRRLRGAPGWIMAAGALAWIGLGSFIFYNTNILNEYRTTDDLDRRAAEYEKALLAYEKVPQPHIIDVKLTVDLYPREVRARSQGIYTIENRTASPLPAVHVRWTRPLQMQLLEVEGAHLSKEYPQFDYRIYEFDEPMQPGATRQIRFATLLEERGFTNADGLTRIVDNGTFLNNYEIAPVLGMGRDALLRDRSKRRKHGLPAELRPPKLEDESANAHHYLRHDSDWVTAELTVTTDADQTPIAPGYTVSDTVNGERRTLVTRTDSPIMHFFSIQSARYAVAKETWTGRDGKSVDLAVYFHPDHEYNVQRMLDAMKLSLSVFSERFSPFQFHQARILEFPAYERFAQSFANTVPYSESIGFIQNYHDERSDETIDLVSYVTAHEIGHQWWAHQVIGADKQGMTMLSETFAQYSALLVMEEMYGKEQIRKFLKGELDTYLRSRGGEVVEELPLNRVEDQAYIHYRKGSLAMYWLKEVAGEEVVNRALQKLLAQFAFKPAPYPASTDFIRLLREEAGPQHDALITDLFEKITLYDMKASNATAKRLADGKYEVTFTVEGRKLYADGEGSETEAPLQEVFEVGAFTAEPGKQGYTGEDVVLIDRQPLKTGQQTITLLVDQPPEFVGVDPYNKRIDRDSDDNLTRVVMQ